MAPSNGTCERWPIGSDIGLSQAACRTVTLVWYGDLALRRALDDGLIELHGPRRLCETFPSWLQLNRLADVPRQNGPPRV